MASLNQEGKVSPLPPRRRKDRKKAFESSESSSTEELLKPVPPVRPPLPPSRAKSPCRKEPPNPPGSQRQHSSFTMRAIGLVSKSSSQDSDSDRSLSISDALEESELVKETEKLRQDVPERVSAVKTLPSQADGKGVENTPFFGSPVKPPKPAPRHSREYINGIETITGSASGISGLQDMKKTKMDASEAKLNTPCKNVEDSSKLYGSELKVKGCLTVRDPDNKNLGERRSTVAGHETTHGRDLNKTHCRQASDGSKGDKPTPPEKPDFVKRQLSMRTQKEMEQEFQLLQTIKIDSGAKSSISFNQPSDLQKGSVLSHLVFTPASLKSNSLNISPKSKAAPKPVTPIVPSRKPDSPQHVLSSKGSDATIQQRNSLGALLSASLQSSPQSIAAPPPKPPRTHAHDDYLQISSHSFDIKPAPDFPSQAASRRSLPILDASPKKGQPLKNSPVKERVFTIQQLASPSSFSPPSPSSKGCPKEGAIKFNAPPARPPPPKRRPNSEDNPTEPSTLSHSVSEYPNAGEGWPVLFPSETHNRIRKKLAHMHGLHSRHPSDKLPLTPVFNKPLQRLHLQKSFSSECLHTVSQSSSLDVEFDDDDDAASAMSRSSSDCQYEAVIDPDGYAVPSAVMRLPGKWNDQLHPQNTGVSPSKSLTRIKRASCEPIHGKNVNTAGPCIIPISEQNLDKVNKQTMNMVRQKINQAYAGVGGASCVLSDRPESGWEFVQNEPDASESVMESTVLKKRVEYCASVRRRSCRGVRRSKEYHSAIYPQLFEYCLVIALRPLVGEEGYEPYLLHRFPENVSGNLAVPSFCFPDATAYKPGSATSLRESYSFVMTSADGSRIYGYCRRIQPPDASLPEVVCIVSPIDAFNMYNTLLNEIEARRRISFDLAAELIAASFGRPLPKPGKVCHVRTLDASGDMETIFLNRSNDSRLDNVNYESPLHYLGTDKLVKVFSSLLMERRIILYSSSLSVLTQTSHALCALLYPFHWQHVYIPILPGEMLDAVCAPMPFVAGVLTSFLPRVQEMDLEEVLIVDLDKKMIIKSQGDESTILPKKMQKALKTAINMCKIDAEAHKSQWLMITEAFLRMFIETVGHFINHIRTQQDGNRIFQKEGFILEIVSKELREFLEWFTETQMFEVFIMNHIEKSDTGGNSDLFLQRLAEFKESKDEAGRQKGLGAKVKNFGKALKTKLHSS